jgi:hypothetical protein
MLAVAAWLSSLKPPARPAVYGALLATLAAPASDVCVQLTAVDTLRQMVADWDFDDEQFLPFVAPLLQQLPRLLSECSSIESQVCTSTCPALSAHACCLSSSCCHSNCWPEFVLARCIKTCAARCT